MNPSITPAVVADTTDGQVAPVLQLLRFALGSERYALRIDAVREILEVTRTTPLPLMPEFVRGVMNLRGAVVPVIDLAARLGLPAAVVGRRSCVIIVDVNLADDAGTQRIGLLVDAVYEVFDTLPGELEAVPRLGTRIEPHYIRSMARVRGQSTAELNLETVLETGELSALIARQSACH